MTQLYNASMKQWDHTGYVVPEFEHSESQYPSAELNPAAWLPVQRYDKKVEEYTVAATGKVVALDRQGKAVPAGLNLSFEAAGGSTILTYVAADYSEGTIDLTTGVSYATNGTTTYTQTEVTTALRALGLISATEFARDFIGEPVGYAPYTYWQWCGGDGWDPTRFRKHNHSLQHQVAIGTDKVVQVPLLPAAEATETMGDGSISAAAITFGTSQWHTSAALSVTTRYSSLVTSGTSIVGYVFGKFPVATITEETPITDSGSTLAAKTEVDSIAAVLAGGSSYFYIDYEAGVLFLWEQDGNAVPTGFTDGTSTITYYAYEDASTANTGDITVCTGNLQPGDFVTFDARSDYVKWTPDIGTASGAADGEAYSADPEYDTEATNSVISGQLEAAIHDAVTRPIGQVLAIWQWPRSGIDKVMTQYTTLGNVEQMPGTATGGRTDSLNISGSSDKVVVINFIRR